MLRDRKFEQGDVDKDGVADDWVPEEFVTDNYWELTNGRSATHRYFIDQGEFYGGGASQAIELYGPGPTHTSIFQTGLQVMKGKQYVFYVYLKLRGTGSAWVELGKLGRSAYGRKEFAKLSDRWEKYTAEFVSPEDTPEARIRIGVEGQGIFWIDSASLMPTDNLGGMRRDVIEALKPLRIPIMRYPGGCFADEFHWMNAIGPRDKRPTTWSDVWQEWDPNDFGIDEFMDFAGELGFQAHFTANYASGIPEEAAHWVEYVNGSKQTTWGQERLRNGHPEPYDVKLWAVGNEPAESCRGEYTGGTNVAEYARRFLQFKSAMRNVDPSVRIMAGGSPPGPATWNRDLLGLLPEPVDLLAMSLYTGKGGRVLQICDLTDYYHRVVAEPQEFEHMLDGAIAGMGNRFPQDHPTIAITEYNSWWMPETGDPDYHLCNALYLAGVYNALFRHANQAAIAEWNTTVNVQGLVSVDPTGVKLTPPYFAYLLYHNHIGNQVLTTQTSSPTVPFNPQLPTVDAVATLGQDGHMLYLAVINRSEGDDIAITIRLTNWTPQAGTATRMWELNGNNRDAANPYGSTGDVNIRERAFSVEQVPFSYHFPAHSVTVLEIPGHLRKP
ncbi:MAG: alpha-L-arabinofuranosidase C-terminal domain-containing protein [Terriglobia bacterium]